MRYTSPLSLFGLPLVEVVLPSIPVPGAPKESPVARGWLAIGPVAVGFVAFGGLATGAFAFGGLTLALVSFGGLSVGGLAFGGGAIGWWAAGGLAVAADAALGGLAVAGRHALGGVAVAPHANDAAAREFFATGLVLPVFRTVAANSRWLLIPFLVMLLVPLFTRKRVLAPGDVFKPR